MNRTITDFSTPYSNGRKALSWIVLTIAIVAGSYFAAYFTRMRSEVRDSKGRFDRAVNGSQSGLWEWSNPTNDLGNSETTGRVWYSDRFAELLGYSPGEIEYNFRWFKSKLHPDDIANVQRLIAVSLEYGTDYSAEYRLRTKRGKYLWFSARGVPHYNAEGRAIYLSGSIRDIDQLKRESLRLERLVGSAPVAMILCGQNQLVTEYNLEAEKLFGWTRQEMIDHSVDKIVSLSDASHHSSAMQARVAELGQHDDDIQITKIIYGQAKHKDGTEFPAKIQLRAYKYGDVMEFVAVIHDKNKLKEKN